MIKRMKKLRGKNYHCLIPTGSFSSGVAEILGPMNAVDGENRQWTQGYKIQQTDRRGPRHHVFSSVQFTVLKL